MTPEHEKVSEVSIPKWCDYKIYQSVVPARYHVVSIPKWCDYKKNRQIRLARQNGFQFQNGAIISYVVVTWSREYCMFQFQNGAIISYPQTTPISS